MTKAVAITLKQKTEHLKEVSKIAEPEAFELTADNNSYIGKLDGKKALFVDFYTRLNGNITDACAAVPINRQTYYNWLENDEVFRNAIIEAESGLNDTIREVLINKAGSGDMTAVIFYLKNRHPDFKQNNQNAQVNVQVNNIISEKKEGYGI